MCSWEPWPFGWGFLVHLECMRTPDSTKSKRRLAALIAALTAIVVLAGIGVYGLIAGPRTGDNSDSVPAPSPPEVTVPSGPGRTPNQPDPLPVTDDPEEFARAVATALFTWDTGSGMMPLDYTAPLVDAGDPTGQEQAGLANDIAGYLPSRDAWIDLRGYATTQSLTISDIYVPDAWNEAVAQAKPGQLPAGAVAYTVEGTRHREGVWEGEPTTSEHEVAFTIFLACPPADTSPKPDSKKKGGDGGASCYLLRLSVLDQPLT